MRWERRRLDMVRGQLAARGVCDERVLGAMARVPRHEFVPARERGCAYEDRPLPIGHGQTISQPYVVALMSEVLELTDASTVLEIGTGSGYHTAVLAELAQRVHSIEIVPELAEMARAALDRLGYERVQTRLGDGYEGWPEAAPFDAVVLTAAPDHVPPRLLEQLAPNGRMVLPLGVGDLQELVRIVHVESGFESRSLAAVRFVPMTGAARLRG